MIVATSMLPRVWTALLGCEARSGPTPRLGPCNPGVTLVHSVRLSELVCGFQQNLQQVAASPKACKKGCILKPKACRVTSPRECYVAFTYAVWIAMLECLAGQQHSMSTSCTPRNASPAARMRALSLSPLSSGMQHRCTGVGAITACSPGQRREPPTRCRAPAVSRGGRPPGSRAPSPAESGCQHGLHQNLPPAPRRAQPAVRPPRWPARRQHHCWTVQPASGPGFRAGCAALTLSRMQPPTRRLMQPPTML